MFYKVMLYKVLWRNLLPIGPGTPGRTPSLFDKCTGFFYMRYITHGTSRLRSRPKDKALISYVNVYLAAVSTCYYLLI